MANVKKAAAAAKPAAKPEVTVKPAASTKEVKAEVKAPAKAAAKKTTAKKTTAKKAPAKRTRTVKKVEATINFQFSGKEYKTEDFINIAKDVWKYDLGKKAADFKSVELYVKPEENKAYYVINGEVSGDFDI